MHEHFLEKEVQLLSAHVLSAHTGAKQKRDSTQCLCTYIFKNSQNLKRIQSEKSIPPELTQTVRACPCTLLSVEAPTLEQIMLFMKIAFMGGPGKM